MTVIPQTVDVFDGFHIVPRRLPPKQVLRFDTALTTPWKAIGERTQRVNKAMFVVTCQNPQRETSFHTEPIVQAFASPRKSLIQKCKQVVAYRHTKRHCLVGKKQKNVHRLPVEQLVQREALGGSPCHRGSRGSDLVTWRATFTSAQGWNMDGTLGAREDGRKLDSMFKARLVSE